MTTMMTAEYTIETAQSLRAQATHIEHNIAAAMRKDGKSWAEIGKAFGVTRQAAQQRFGVPVAFLEPLPGKQ